MSYVTEMWVSGSFEKRTWSDFVIISQECYGFFTLTIGISFTGTSHARDCIGIDIYLVHVG